VSTLPHSLLASIGRAVQRAGGDMDDVTDLIDVWERIFADRRGRLDRMRYDATHPRCCCAREPLDLTTDGRCSRCHGIPAR
jgi:hypothetical protein